MLGSLKELFLLLTPRQKKHFLILQFFMILSAVIELFSITSIVPFIGAAADPDILENNEHIRWLYNTFGFDSLDDFLLFSGLFFVFMIIFANSVHILTLYLLNRYSARIGAEFAHSLNRYYLYQPLLYHLSRNSSKLTNNVIIECDRVGRDLVNPFLRLNARIFLMAILAIFFFMLNPMVAVSSLIILGIAYLVVFRISRGNIETCGHTISENNEGRLKLLRESYDGIKEIKVTGTEPIYMQDFDIRTSSVSRATATVLILGQSPYYIIEAIAFSGIIVVALYIMGTTGGLAESLTMLGLYAMIGYKLIPAFQRSYHAAADIKGCLPAFNNIKSDLQEASLFSLKRNSGPAIKPAKAIDIQQLSFKYPGRNEHAISDINLVIPVNSITVITGHSGAGKSTLIDLILGLITPDSGHVYIDDIPLATDNILGWQRAIGYVPQHVHIADSSMKENIAFGLPTDQINEQAVELSARLSAIDSLASELESGYNTRIGEKGGKLSGGQRQRIGLARALYRDPSVLILDEPTSALDKTTELEVINSLKELSKSKTVIIISHSKEIQQHADQVVFMSDGLIKDINHNPASSLT